MKILFVDLQYDYGIKSRGLNYIGEDGFRKTFVKLGHAVETFYYDEYLRPPRYADLQRDLIARADRVKPDMVFFILFEDQFTYETLDLLRSRYATANWFCDDPWRFDSFTSRYAQHLTWCITTDKYSVGKYHRVGQRNVIVSQWAAIDQHAAPAFDGYQYEVSFVGGIHPYRKWFVQQLKERGIPIEAFGNGWPAGSVTADEMNRIFRASKISLNLSNSSSYDSRYLFSSLRHFRDSRRSLKKFSQIKARNFEIPYFGGFQLSDYVPAIEDYFLLGGEIACYANLDEAELLIRYYLENDVLRESVRQAGQARAQGEHGYYHRLKVACDQIESTLAQTLASSKESEN